MWLTASSPLLDVGADELAAEFDKQAADAVGRFNFGDYHLAPFIGQVRNRFNRGGIEPVEAFQATSGLPRISLGGTWCGAPRPPEEPQAATGIVGAVTESFDSTTTSICSLTPSTPCVSVVTAAEGGAMLVSEARSTESCARLTPETLRQISRKMATPSSPLQPR